MTEDKWDDIIKERLVSHEESYDPASWDKLSFKIDQELIDVDEKVISQVKERLSNYQEPIIESHWQILKKELEALEQRRYRLWLIKSIEAVTMLLLVWTFTNFGGLLKTVELDHIKKIDRQEELNSYAVVEHDLFTNNSVEVSNLLPLDNPKTVDKLKTFASKDISRLSRLPSRVLNAIEVIIDKKSLGKSSEHIIKLRSLNPISTLSIDALTIDISSTSPSYAAAVLTETKDTYKTKNDGWWIGASITQSSNLINSGFNFRYFKSQVSSGLLGSAGSVTVSWQSKILELQTGLSYSNKSYAPSLLRSFSKSSDNTYLENNLELISFDQLQVPLIAKLHGLNNSKNHLYGFIGFGANMILSYDYDIQKTVQPSARVSALDLQPQLDLTTLPVGVFENGHTSDNLYITGIIGFGIESTLSNKFALFFQPQYQYHLTSPLNSYVQKVHSINIEAGLKIRL